jgi:Kef-type K+ transport system membrane component KefB
VFLEDRQEIESCFSYVIFLLLLWLNNIWFTKVNLLGFTALVFFSGLVTSFLGISPFVGHMFAGAILGPTGVDAVPFPDILVWAGEVSVIGLAVEAGASIDLDAVAEDDEVIAGAITSTIFTVLIAIGIGNLLLGPNLLFILALVACIFPTGKTTANERLQKNEFTNTPLGNFFRGVTAFDDLLPLILVIFLQVLSTDDDDMTTFDDFLPIIITLGLFVVVGIPLIKFFPQFVDSRILIRMSKGVAAIVSFTLMVGVTIGLIFLFISLGASHLIASIIAGLTFCQIQTGREEFSTMRNNFFYWLRTIFFATSIGFEVRKRHVSRGLLFH